MNFVNGRDEHELLLVDSENTVLGRGFVYEFMEAEILDKDRMNYFIAAVPETQDKCDDVKRIITAELVNRAKILREQHSDMDARVYHCCVSENREEIEFYKTIPGFEHDEGMHILSCDLDQINMNDSIESKYTIREDNLATEEQMQSFIDEHKKVFYNNAYSIEKIQKLKGNEGFKSIGIYDGKKIIGNILLHVEEESDQRIGWLEDMFVNKSYRNEGLGGFLAERGIQYFKSIGLHESRLELWSANKRASKLYSKAGFRLLTETEASIGMAI